MYEPKLLKHFQKDANRMERRQKERTKLTETISLICNRKPLPPRYENHPLHGNWRDCDECHIEPDWLLIYEVDDAAQTVVFHRTGTHADLY
jgi:mRNA interferase YafQ